MTKLRPIPYTANQETHGLALAADVVYTSEIAQIDRLRERQAAYRASLPTSVEAANREAISVLSDLIEPDERGGFLEALHLSIALGAMIKKDGNALGCVGPERDAAIFVSERVSDALLQVHGELEHMNTALRTPIGIG
ncbi:hypothetical protein SAMN04488117_101596 [Celeribacter baekdonensis]|uniref:Uncharacterized protein n=1 Tax=Celeribacter baekdonensis TaxID=875171 RepID=A0A1G7GJN0_9RHOB|nr:hypothetical protein [Celeribacter baekdonensis]SDE88362.1 hypothetical protein SAMN04488117_101596 [Celeribacter baekdonensis]